MAFFEFLKKIFSEEQKEEDKPIGIPIKDLSTRLEEEVKTQEKLIESIKEKLIQDISTFRKEIVNQINILQSVSLQKRKEEERMKLVVKENLYVYISHIKRLIEDLNKISILPPKDYIPKAGYIFNNFSQTSRNSFEKATILIGEEIGKAKDIVNNLISSYNSSSKQLEPILSKISHINLLNSNIIEQENIKNSEQEILNIKQKAEKEIKTIEESIKQLETQIKDYRNSDDYKNLEIEKQKNQSELKIIEQEILKIKQGINIKSLSNIYHIDKKKLNLLQRYSDNFINTLKEDSKLEILTMIKSDNLKELKDKLITLSQQIKQEIDDKSSIIEKQIQRLRSEIVDKSQEIEQSEKRKIKLKERQSEVAKEILEKAKVLKIEIIS